MRILIANEGIDDAGGVDTYLRGVAPALTAGGHAVAFLHYNRRTAASRMPSQPAFGVLDGGLDAVLADVSAWQPDVVFSHNMRPLAVEAALLGRWPVVKMMHGYFGTCISGQKAHLFPSRRVCAKRFDAACLAYFFPRRCGQADPLKLARQFRWAREQRSMFGAYAAIVVASEHMREEYSRNGVAPDRVHTLPLFAPAEPAPAHPTRGAGAGGVLFLGRMTNLKGGDLLIRAVAHASRRLGQRLPLTMAGDGPARRGWEALAAREGVHADFTGWIDARTRSRLLATVSILAVPSVWPEPFGLVGLEAAAAGVPTVAFDAGGVRQWLRDGVNGVIVPGPPAARTLGDALASLCDDEARRRELAAGALGVAAQMTIDRHVDALVKVLLMARGSTAIA